MQLFKSILGGAIGGAMSAIPEIGPMLVAGITGFSSTAIGMALQNEFEGTDYSFAQIMFVSTINELISSSMCGLFDTIKINGLNSGRNSYATISKTINTKFYNGTISRVSINTFSKVLTYNMLGSLIGSAVSGVMDETNANDWMARFFNERTGW